MARSSDLDDVPTSGKGDNRRKPTDTIDIYKFPDKKYVPLRLLPGVYMYGGHWIKTKKRDGEKMGSFYSPCAAWDPENNTRKGNRGVEYCAWCRHEQWNFDHEVDVKKRLTRFSVDAYANAIIRSLERKGSDGNEPTKAELKTMFKDKESDSWTPIRPIRMTTNLATNINDLKQLNVHEDEETGESRPYKVNDPKFGCDINIMVDSDKPPAQYYNVQLGPHAPLKKIHKTYLQWDLSDLTEYPSTEEVERDFKDWAKRNGIEADEEDLPKTKKKSKVMDDEDDDPPPKTKKRAVEDDEDDDPPPKAKKKAKVVEDDDEEEDDPPKKRRSPPPDEDDEEDDPPPKAKKKSKVVEDDEEEDDPPPKKAKKPAFDDDDEDEDPPPKAKKKSKVVEDDEEDDDPPPKAKKKAKPVEDDEEEDDPPPKKRRAPPPDDEEDDDPPPKAKKKAKPVEDDDDEEDDPPPKAKKKAKAVEEDDEEDDPPPKKKKRPVDDGL